MKRPSRHTRTIRTKRGMRTVMVNPGIKKKAKMPKKKLQWYCNCSEGEKCAECQHFEPIQEQMTKLERDAYRKTQFLGPTKLSEGQVAIDGHHFNANKEGLTGEGIPRWAKEDTYRKTLPIKRKEYNFSGKYGSWTEEHEKETDAKMRAQSLNVALTPIEYRKRQIQKKIKRHKK
jgi:hypothetical protein